MPCRIADSARRDEFTATQDASTRPIHAPGESADQQEEQQQRPISITQAATRIAQTQQAAHEAKLAALEAFCSAFDNVAQQHGHGHARDFCQTVAQQVLDLLQNALSGQKQQSPPRQQKAPSYAQMLKRGAQQQKEGAHATRQQPRQPRPTPTPTPKPHSRSFPSSEKRISEGLPVLADYLEFIDARNEARIVQLKAELADQLRATEERLAVAQSSLFSNGFNFQVTAATTTTATTAVTDIAGHPGRGDGSGFVSTQSSIINSRDTSPTATDMIMVKPEPPPRYHMCRAVKKVEALWSEWTVGLRGGPAIADLDSRWGSRWRAGRQSELQWYSLRLEVIRKIPTNRPLARLVL
ncbi:hypothetical protein HIM_10556 [Hirsutella minnesotensis 3608]|uniref:Transcription activator GCR1-like domain-containing protein n=1 Tax=Hirsutella minnesotensis 3608 TaxID=1043627 RepID=A0A0F7ZX39_9HYPO|nr:hypothetical protein HIM_10556 [Hirsutella minnesotensis 3608]